MSREYLHALLRLLKPCRLSLSFSLALINFVFAPFARFSFAFLVSDAMSELTPSSAERERRAPSSAQCWTRHTMRHHKASLQGNLSPETSRSANRKCFTANRTTTTCHELRSFSLSLMAKPLRSVEQLFLHLFFVVASRPKLHRKFRAPEKRANRAAHCASQANVFAFDEQKSFLLNIPSLSVVASGTFRCESWLKFCFECLKVSVEFKAK
jgi:hypothetical protein